MKSSDPEHWLFQASELSSDQQQALANLAAASPDLRRLAAGWRAAEAELRQARLIGPDSGFTERWRSKLMHSRARRRTWQVRLVLAATLTGAFGSLGLLAALALNSPAGIGAAVMQAAITAHKALDSGYRVAAALTEGLPIAAGVLLSSVTLAWLSVIWFASLYRFALQSLPNGEREND